MLTRRLIALALIVGLFAGGVWFTPDQTLRSEDHAQTRDTLRTGTPGGSSSLNTPTKPQILNADTTEVLQVTNPPAPKAPKKRVPTKADEPPVPGKEPVAVALPADFLDKMIDASGKLATFSLPDGRQASGTVEVLQRDAQGVLQIQGRLSQPQPGTFFFQRQTVPGVAGSLVGNVRFDDGKTGFRVDPLGPGGAPVLVERRIDQIICKIPEPDPRLIALMEEPQHAPQAHPTNIQIPDYQNGIIPLQSLPGATPVVYLDFDGEKGPFSGWGNFDAEPSGANNTQIREVWQRVAEDFQAFNVNITTDRRMYDNAPQGRRQHVVVTPTNRAAPGAGGVAFIGSFNWNGNTVCWAFYTTGKSAAEVISHEVGHTLGLSHDGRSTPSEDYYGGHGSGETGWAPIMGVGYYQNLTQWSRGEYTSANNTEDDISIIINNNNDIDTRPSDIGSTFDRAAYLEILPNNTVSNEGIIESRTDVDTFRFTTTGGAVTLTASVVNAGPNIDLSAEIYNTADTLIASSNPDGQINATVSANLAAGDYTLRITGVGRGDPLADGYSDYGSMGTFLVTGSVAGGIKPDRFSINENSANGTTVGTVQPRNGHGTNTLAYAITSGNANNAFAVNPTTGAITVANSAELNFEVLSTRWDDPAIIPLFVTISDIADPLLTETVRVIVTVNDVNEVPTISGGSVTMLEHTRIGTEVFQVIGGDQDRYEFPAFAIIGGNTANAFSIDPLTGKITVASDLTAATQPTFTLSVRATDHGTPALSATATVTISVLDVAPGYVPGAITRTFYDGISGESVNNLTSNAKFPDNPDSEETLGSFDGGEHGDNYGSTVRGYLIPPTTGAYTFWIASDDSSELRLSTNATAGSAVVIASVSGATGQREWTRFPSQQSTQRTLQAGQVYYIEARQKEGGGGDHVAVAWAGPGFSQRVIPGLYLAPFTQNYAPKIPAATFSVRQNAFNGATVGTVQVTDANSKDARGGFTILGGTGSGRFGIDPNTGRLFVTNNTGFTQGTSFTLQVRVTDNGTPALSGTGTITVNVIGASVINATGVIQEFWTDISGNNVSALTSNSRYPNTPSGTRPLSSFDTGGDYADNYGSRIRGYVVPQTSGSYTFYVAGDDETQLRLSTDTNPANAALIASIATYSGRNKWTDFPSQKSAARTLIAGQRYYIETLHKEGTGGDFVQVAWTGPGIASPTILTENVLDAFDANQPPSWTGAPYAFIVEEGAAAGTLVGTPSGNDGASGLIVYAITDGNSAGAFTIDVSTGAITVANSAALSPGQTMTLQVAAQDSGGGIYPLKSATTTVAITIVPDLRLVSPASSVVNIPAGVGILLEASNDGKTGTSISWSKTSGPGTVTFESPNSLATGAIFSTAGAYVLRCTELNGIATSSFDVTVNVGVSPAFALSGSKVGEQAITPHHTVTNGIYTIYAAGAGIPSSGTPDDLYLLSVPANGNVTVTARVVSVAGIDGSNSRAGVMIRESLASNARSAFCGVTSQGGGRFIFRANPATNSNNASATAAPSYWVRLIRSGNSFTAQIAPDSNGSAGTFVTLGSAQTITMSSNVLVGLAATSGSTGIAGKVVIDRLTISPNPANIEPNVNAGTDATATANGTAALAGSVTDDGKPIAGATISTAWSKVSGPGSVSFTTPDTAQSTASSTTPGFYALRLVASDNHTRTFDDVKLTFPLAIEQWRQQHFGTGATDEATAGNLADPDSDGLSNLIEYALDSSPLVSNAGNISTEVATIGNERFLRLSVTKNPLATGITFGIEVTGDLSTPDSWSTNGTTVELNTPETLRARDNTPVDSAAQRHIRLKVTQP